MSMMILKGKIWITGEQIRFSAERDCDGNFVVRAILHIESRYVMDEPPATEKELEYIKQRIRREMLGDLFQ